MKIFFIGGLTTGKEGNSTEGELSVLKRVGYDLGREFALSGHEMHLCSPFKDSLDRYVALGAAEVTDSKLFFHYPDIPIVKEELRKLLSRLTRSKVKRIPCSQIATSENDVNDQYSWLFAQLSALDSCVGVIAVGGKQSGSAQLLFQLATSKNKSILPLKILGGAAANYYDKYSWDLHDVLGKYLEQVTKFSQIAYVPKLLEKLIEGVPSHDEQRFFISYARARPREADFVEALIRRRNGIVYRDEEDFEPAADTQEDIIKNIKKSNVFVAIWCKEYACSPWCFDELELAIKMKNQGVSELWIFCVDDTRMVHPGARSLNYYREDDRNGLEAKILHLMNRLAQSY